tara:strand:+ start:3647 stop:4549 length:903 start_codon:yes stop_codon:yes gene_type:complete
MNQVETIDTANYEAMAKVMGMAGEQPSSKAKSTLARLRINHSAIMGTAEIKGKSMNLEVVKGGTYRLEVPDTDETYYALGVNIRPYMQRFMYKRFVKGTANSKNMFVKTVMADNLNMDLKDNSGGVNCGKLAGYVQDFKALPEDMQNLIRQIKRVRVILGTVDLLDPTNANGDPINKELTNIPCIWEVDQREAFKHVGEPFQTLLKQRRLPVQYTLDCATDERKMPNGNTYYVPNVSLNTSEVLTIGDDVQDTFRDFVEWVTSYNAYITSEWDDKNVSNLSPEDASLVEEFITVDTAVEN